MTSKVKTKWLQWRPYNENPRTTNGVFHPRNPPCNSKMYGKESRGYNVSLLFRYIRGFTVQNIDGSLILTAELVTKNKQNC